MDIAIVSYFNPADLPGGAEGVAWAEAEILSEDREVAFVSASQPTGSAPFAEYRLGGWTRSFYRPSGAPRSSAVLAAFHLLSVFNPVALFEALVLFRRLRPVTVHTHNLVALSPAVWLAARLSGARVVHTHHDLWLLCERATMTGEDGSPCNETQPACRVCKAVRSPKRLLLHLVGVEVFPSEWLRSYLGRGGPIVRGFATSAPSLDHQARPEGPPVIAYVGALTPHKLGPLLEAFECAATELSMKLALAGSGPLAAAVRAAAETNTNIEYLGQVDTAGRDRLLERATIVVIPSTCAENSPLVFFEALAAGVPVVASEIGGIPELAQFGNLILVPPGDSRALADALTSLLTDVQRLDELRAAARRNREEDPPTRFAGQMSTVLEDVRASAR